MPSLLRTCVFKCDWKYGFVCSWWGSTILTGYARNMKQNFMLSVGLYVRKAINLGLSHAFLTEYEVQGIQKVVNLRKCMCPEAT